MKRVASMAKRGPLVLSLFPGVGLLDMAFEQAGFSIVRGPDLIHGGDVRRWIPPAASDRRRPRAESGSRLERTAR